MAFAGGVGVEIELKSRTANELFSESNSRFLIEVSAVAEQSFLKCVDKITFEKIGRTTSSTALIINDAGENTINANLIDLKSIWQRPLS